MNMTSKYLDCVSPWFWKDLLPVLLGGHTGDLLTNLMLLRDTKYLAAVYIKFFSDSS